MNILFVTKGSFGSKDATGSMLNNIFEGMPDTQILQFPLRPVEQNKVDPIESVSILSGVHYSIFSILLQKIDTLSVQGCLGRVRKIIRSILVFFEGITPPVILSNEYDKINSFKPDVIYTLAADIRVLRASRKFANRYNIPIVIHNMDDYYNIDNHSPNIIRNFYNLILRREYRKAYKLSHKSLGIGPKMIEEYSREFGLPFDWVMNCVDSDNILHYKTLNDHVSLIIFSGGLHGGRAQSLAKIAGIVEKTGSVRLEIYTSKKEIGINGILFEGFKQSKLYEYVEREKMFENLSRADILLHVESFEPNNIRYFRLSMSTKIPEYMAVGRPILCVGPQCIATVEFVKNKGVGHVIHDESNFDKALSVLENKEYRLQLVNKAHDMVMSDFNKINMQNKLESVLKFNINRNIVNC